MMRIRFLVNGLGLGNSTRCHSVIQHLHDRGVEVSVATSGNGQWYFEDKRELVALDILRSIHYGAKEGQISILKTLAAMPKMVSTLVANSHLITRLLSEERPDAVVIDSDYNFRPMKRLGIPIIALNNADVVVQSFQRFAPTPKSIRAQFFAVEMMDYLFHRFVPDLVLSPSLDPEMSVGSSKFRRVAAIVRKQYKVVPWLETPSRVVIMLSGSVFGSPVVLKRDSYPFQIDVIGRAAPPGWEPKTGIAYHSKLLDNSTLLAEADVVVVNGGFSAVSEAFCMNKPMVVIPVPRHAEQWVNGQTIERLGVGIVSTEEGLEKAMLDAFARIADLRHAYEVISDWQNGAEQAADAILEFVKSR